MVIMHAPTHTVNPYDSKPSNPQTPPGTPTRRQRTRSAERPGGRRACKPLRAWHTPQGLGFIVQALHARRPLTTRCPNPDPTPPQPASNPSLKHALRTGPLSVLIPFRTPDAWRLASRCRDVFYQRKWVPNWTAWPRPAPYCTATGGYWVPQTPQPKSAPKNPPTLSASSPWPHTLG